MYPPLYIAHMESKYVEAIGTPIIGLKAAVDYRVLRKVVTFVLVC